MKVKYKTLQSLFRNEKRWCQGSDSKSKDGKFSNPNSPHAVKWCMRGGLKLVYGYGPKQVAAFKRILKVLPENTWLLSWNDAVDRTIHDIRKLVKEAKV